MPDCPDAVNLLKISFQSSQNILKILIAEKKICSVLPIQLGIQIESQFDKFFVKHKFQVFHNSVIELRLDRDCKKDSGSFVSIMQFSIDICTP